ncbi:MULTISPECIES: LexA family transcriptional regulator [Vibrio]|uniref:XRE family transcriptional regulator n=1 Tax=Vibrio TaxID=662 RepID=UPI002158BF6B|nr:LexA family transcriptional regulator [Vibrio splendidus]
MSARQMASKCNVSAPAMLRYLKGEAQPNVDSLIKISHAFNVSADWLIASGNVSLENAKVVTESNYTSIPIYSAEASAGNGCFTDTDKVIGKHLVFTDDLQRLGLKKEKTCAIKASGDSMVPTLMNGDLLVIDMRKQEGVLDGVYAITLDDSLLVKRLRYDLASQGYHIISDNEDHDNFLLPKGELERLHVNGRVRQVVKNL